MVQVLESQNLSSIPPCTCHYPNPLYFQLIFPQWTSHFWFAWLHNSSHSSFSSLPLLWIHLLGCLTLSCLILSRAFPHQTSSFDYLMGFPTKFIMRRLGKFLFLKFRIELINVLSWLHNQLYLSISFIKEVSTNLPEAPLMWYSSYLPYRDTT